MSSIKFIYFDLGKVIFDFDHQIACRYIAQQTGVPSEKVWDSLFDSGLEVRYETGLIDCETFHRKYCEATGTDMPQQEFLGAFANVFEPNRRIFGLIAQLRAINFPIGVLSNTCHAHWSFVCANYKIMREFFRETILSYEVKSMKPDGMIYQKAIEQAGCAAGTCFFVDDRQENVDGAIEAGMDAVLYTSVSQLVRDLESRGVEINY